MPDDRPLSCSSDQGSSSARYLCNPSSSNFTHSDLSAFHEVQQLKSCIQTIFLVLSQNGVVGATSPVLGALPPAPPLPAVVQPPPPQHGHTRKRPAPPPPQPECPVALRPIASCPTLSSQFMPHWTWLMPGLMRPPSPTLPAPPSLETSTTTTTAQQEHEQTKWSNPSSVESNGLKTDSTAGESGNIDIVGMDGSESSTSSTSTQAMLTSPAGQAQLPAYLKDTHPIFPFPQKSADLSQPSFLYGMVKSEPPPSRSAPIAASLPIGHVHSITTPERKHRKQQNDDYVKLIREQDLSDERISAIPIPVPQALSLDPNFRAVSEQQVVQQVVQNKRFEEVDVRESMTHLCKKLAEKRVFGSKLMAETTVAGLNHSTFPNLPIEGIMYIQHVCRKVLGDRFSSDDDFWESLRDSMRKLAARCRRVRHAKKTKSSREEGVLLAGEKSAGWPEGSVAQTLQSLNLPTEKPTHSVRTIPIVSERKKAAEINDVKLAETLQNGLHALASATLANQTLPATLAEMSSAWSLLQLHKNTESLLQQRDLRSDDASSP
ncbi:hypothetical protein ANCCAN_02820 [Ancylostoma caninum]|uniref:Uncharacterized protein n=1 Tax=Ancylostoma caninum TaxID=29170 RepID=A0A368H350_ANCCA|nr:hypothetical protein ANCCAN_02820 [Ancylostoma caninum]